MLLRRDTGRKRGAHTLILRELGYLDCARPSNSRTDAKRARIALHSPAALPASAPVNNSPAVALLEAVRACAQIRPGLEQAAKVPIDDAVAHARRCATGVALPADTLRKTLYAACRVGHMRLVRLVMELMEGPASMPYDTASVNAVLKFLIDRSEFWRAFHMVRYLQRKRASAPTKARARASTNLCNLVVAATMHNCIDVWVLDRLREAERTFGDRRVFNPAMLDQR